VCSFLFEVKGFAGLSIQVLMYFVNRFEVPVLCPCYTFPMKYSLRPEIPADARERLIEYSDLSARLLHGRGVTDREAARVFLNPDFEASSHDPFLLKDAEKAADRIISAIKNNEKIVIYSDYDTDGIPAGAMMHDFFKKIGYHNFSNYIPHRHDEGFGLNNGAIAEIAENGAKLLVTLDCGITDVGPVALANTKGIDVIITDHHTPQAELPAAYAIVNPKQADCKYPEKNLCGSGVGWKLIQAILKKERFGLGKGQEKWLLDMVGIATLSDMVPLTGENRALAYYGLSVLRKSPRKGLVRLLDKIGVKQKDLVEDDIGFSIGPRINAASRMGLPMDAFSLLVADDEAEAERLAEHLDSINNERKGVVAALVKDVKKKIGERYGSVLPAALVLGNPEWKPSLLGLAANTCAEEFDRPVFLWGRDGDGLFKGSCRAGDGSSVHLVELMTAVPALTFTQFGGHMGAGGFTVHPEAIFNLDEILNKAFEKLNNQESKTNSQSENNKEFVDDIIRADDITWSLYDEVNKFAPFGMNNPKPIFMIKDAQIAAVKHFGKEKNHLEILLGKERGASVPAIAFFKTSADFSVPLEPGKTATIIGTLEKSTFKWKPELRIRISDVIA
jgi:single-stranded-DNA-specific exonuclease